MEEINLLEELKKSIKNADIIKFEFGITAQQLSNEEEKSILTVSSNTEVYVNCKKKRVL